ncbi:fumarylacetoacetate hydrolase family protein [Oceanobacillus manasiensis]|uniref:fumarylacetoacetate hydrolase family protein n=1 Tax=Oceanobacillus manasiensis TaxID=586413 RepID=UPI0005AA321F|nr:fumarylacetoacetate hydrolase family protein [Oceanobacillus manasiensis]
MKFVRYTDKNQVFQGVLENDRILQISGDLFSNWTKTNMVHQLSEVKLLAPLIPNQIIGIGANYVASEEELPRESVQHPVFFFKPVSSVIGTGENIVIPEQVENVKFEAELAVVVGKEIKQLLPEEPVEPYVFGYTIANDVTAPDMFHPDGHWTIGKAFDTFTPIGPVVETNLDLDKVRIEAKVNGVRKQSSPTRLMIVTIEEMIRYLSHVMTLQPGDVILTGSPVGAEMVGENIMVECTIEGIGTIRNETKGSY